MNRDNYLALVAKMYYIDKIKQKQIAEQFKITPMAVSRLLKEAEEREIVSIHVKMPWAIDVEIGKALSKKYGIRECYVLDIGNDDNESTVLGSFVADYFVQILPEDAIVGLSWGYTISKFVAALPYIRNKRCSLFQLTGAFSGAQTSVTPTVIINEITKKLDGRIYTLNAPLYASSEEMRDQLLNDPTNMYISALAEKSDINVIGLSALTSNSTTLKSGVISEDDFKELQSLDVAGDIAGTFLDWDGNIVEWKKSKMYTGIPLDVISKSKNTLCVASGKEKTPMLKVVCKTNYFDTLVTSRKTAEELLK